MAQLSAPPFFGYLLGLAALSTALRRRSFRNSTEAIVTGFSMGKHADPLLGVQCSTLWDEPLDDVRTRFGLAGARVVGEGIRAAA